MAFIFIFLDGVGLGGEDESNPFFMSQTPFISNILDGGKLTNRAADKDYKIAALLGLDACLGVDSLPQSATGQTSLFTGINAAKLLGHHLNAYPNTKLKGILAEEGIFTQLKKRHITCTFANAYRPDRLDDLFGKMIEKYSCSTLITYYAGLRFRTLEDLAKGSAVYMDITNEYLIELGYKADVIAPETAGANLASIVRKHDFTLYENFMTDIIGHSGKVMEANNTIGKIDRFLESLVKSMDLERDIILLTSDHGNLENMKIKTHTKNSVPALIIGKRRERFVELLNKSPDITGVTPAIVSYMTSNS